MEGRYNSNGFVAKNERRVGICCVRVHAVLRIGLSDYGNETSGHSSPRNH